MRLLRQAVVDPTRALLPVLAVLSRRCLSGGIPAERYHHSRHSAQSSCSFGFLRWRSAAPDSDPRPLGAVAFVAWKGGKKAKVPTGYAPPAPWSSSVPPVCLMVAALV